MPLSRDQQISLLDEKLTTEELISRKNHFFGQVLKNLNSLYYQSKPLNFDRRLEDDPWHVFRFSRRKSIRRENKDFKVETIDDWPHVTAIVFNDPDVQKIAIERNSRAFDNTFVVSKILTENFQKALEDYGLSVEIEAIFEESHFWDLIAKYRGEIASVDFELVSPNMANMSKSLNERLKAMTKATNSERTNLKFNSARSSALEFDQSDRDLAGIVEYAAKGGGDIKLRLKGLNRRISTREAVKTIEIDELTVEGPSRDVLTLINKLSDPDV